MSFEVWLKQFKKQKTPLGRLARDFIEIGAITIEESFRRYSPCKEAWETYRTARRNYILEIANELRNELDNILSEDDLDCSLWQSSLTSLHNLKDMLADIEDCLDNGFEEDE